MKKVSITILLILPIVLIYFISFLGRIVSKYSRVAAENIEVFVLGEQVENGSRINYVYEEIADKGPLDMEINVLPEFTNDQTYSISASNPEVAEIKLTEEKPQLFIYDCGLERATCNFTITSNDNATVQFNFTVGVTMGQLKELLVFDYDKGSTAYLNEVNIAVGKSKSLGLDFAPKTTLPKYKACFWAVEDPTILSIKQDNNKMTITGLKEGTTTITVASLEKPSIHKDVVVNVETICREEAYFNYFNATKYFTISNNTFDLKIKEGEEAKEGKIVINAEGLTYDDLTIDCVSGADAIDVEKLNSEKVLEFNTNGKSVDLCLYRKTSDAKEIFLDKIRILYIQK